MKLQIQMEGRSEPQQVTCASTQWTDLADMFLTEGEKRRTGGNPQRHMENWRTRKLRNQTRHLLTRGNSANNFIRPLQMIKAHLCTCRSLWNLLAALQHLKL